MPLETIWCPVLNGQISRVKTLEGEVTTTESRGSQGRAPVAIAGTRLREHPRRCDNNLYLRLTRHTSPRVLDCAPALLP
jgi:hypothetical protein